MKYDISHGHRTEAYASHGCGTKYSGRGTEYNVSRCHDTEDVPGECLVWSLVKSHAQLETDGRVNGESVSVNSAVPITSCKPEDNWARKWQRIGGTSRKRYAISASSSKEEQWAQHATVTQGRCLRNPETYPTRRSHLAESLDRESDSAWGAKGQRGCSADSNDGPDGDPTQRSRNPVHCSPTQAEGQSASQGTYPIVLAIKQVVRDLVPPVKQLENKGACRVFQTTTRPSRVVFCSYVLYFFRVDHCVQ